MRFADFYRESVNARQIQQWLKTVETDDTNQLRIIADAMEEIGYPNIANFRDAIEKMQHAKDSKMDQSPSYGGVFWEIRQRLVRFLTEINNWLNRNAAGVAWAGDYQK